MRARLFAERGWVDWLPPHDLSAETLGRAVTEALYKRSAATPVRPPDLAGRTVAADRLVETLDGRRSPRAPAVAAHGVIAPRRPIMNVLDEDVRLA